jgi:hypothetical protein
MDDPASITSQLLHSVRDKFVFRHERNLKRMKEGSVNGTKI